MDREGIGGKTIGLFLLPVLAFLAAIWIARKRQREAIDRAK